MNGVEGKARLVAVKLTKNGRSRSYLMHRLVAYAYLARPPKESRRELVCHINPREVDSYPDNGFCNIYWGTTSDNAADEERAGRPKIGNRRYFRGRQCDSTEEDYEIFSSQTEAAIFVGEDVCQSMISRALRDYAKSVGKSRWKFEYCVMEFEDDEILADIDETTKFGRRFITNRGRTGEFKRVKKNGTFVDIPVEFFIGVDSNGYRLIGNIGGYSSQVRLHRLVFEKFAPEVIKSKEMNTGKMWNVPHDIDVDHINGDKLDNDINNLELLTRTEHSNKRTRVRPVVELDEQGRIIGEWPSVSSAASSTGTQPQTLHKVCLRTNGATRGGRRFAFREVALEGKEPSRKFKRSRFACE
jgi:hypothetical protein